MSIRPTTPEQKQILLYEFQHSKHRIPQSYDVAERLIANYRKVRLQVRGMEAAPQGQGRLDTPEKRQAFAERQEKATTQKLREAHRNGVRWWRSLTSTEREKRRQEYIAQKRHRSLDADMDVAISQDSPTQSKDEALLQR